MFSYANLVIAYLFIFFILGSAVGSFLNVVADRVTKGESVLGRSYCDHCKTPLATFDLLPIISFVGLGARCRYCKSKISWQYPIVETVTATLFALAFFALANMGELSIINLGYWLFLISVMVVVALVDFKYSLIPTTFVFLASSVALFYAYFLFTPTVFLEHVLAAFATSLFFLLIVILSRGRGMGQGDIVLAFLMGMVLGYWGSAVALFLSFLSGACVALLLIGLRKKKFGQTVPFAPFLVFGFLVSLFWWQQIINWYFGMLY